MRLYTVQYGCLRTSSLTYTGSKPNQIQGNDHYSITAYGVLRVEVEIASRIACSAMAQFTLLTKLQYQGSKEDSH